MLIIVHQCFLMTLSRKIIIFKPTLKTTNKFFIILICVMISCADLSHCCIGTTITGFCVCWSHGPWDRSPHEKGHSDIRTHIASRPIVCALSYRPTSPPHKLYSLPDRLSSSDHKNLFPETIEITISCFLHWHLTMISWLMLYQCNCVLYWYVRTIQR